MLQWILAIALGALQLIYFRGIERSIADRRILGETDTAVERIETAIHMVVAWPIVWMGAVLLLALSAIYCEMLSRSFENPGLRSSE